MSSHERGFHDLDEKQIDSLDLKQAAPISADDIAYVKRFASSKGIYWRLADYHYDARLSPSIVLKLVAEIERLNQEVARLQDAVDLERRLKVAARKDADGVRAEVQRNLDSPWPPPRTRS